MFTWRDVLVNEERRAETLRRAEQARLIRSVLRVQKQQPRMIDLILVRVGCWMEMIGRRMQERRIVEECPFSAPVRPHEGAC